jgi:short chain dehydrogenase
MVTHSTPNSRSAAVTGAGGGLGREVAVQLARIGYRVFGIARNDEDIAEVEPASADANGQHRGSSAQRGTGADRRHRHLSDRRAHQQSGLLDPAVGDPSATRGQASWSLWAGPSMTWLPRNSICAITIRDSRPTRAGRARARSAP